MKTTDDDFCTHIIDSGVPWNASASCVDPEMSAPDAEYVKGLIAEIKATAAMEITVDDMFKLDNGGFRFPLSSTVDREQAREAARMIGCDFAESLDKPNS
jgi:hypothetical protein